MISPDEIEHVKILMVGAGGIGCELLKNLILTGFKQIEIIDLDTIELSNLNRQFLFQKIHVGQPKAVIAKQSALKFNPNANIIAHHDTIMNPKYNVEYFKQFRIVLNALDNKAARSHVNRLCLAADVPLIESGSAGYLGQVTFIKKGLTECYDCLPKPAAKSFPGCTIRNTPSEPIHCIVWAKHLFNQLFGSEDPDEAVSPDTEDPENMAEAGQAAYEKKTEVVRVSTRAWAKQTNYDGKKIFNKLFNEDIKYLLSMAKLWEKRKRPEPIYFEQVNSSSEDSTASNGQNGSELNSQKVWTVKECAEQFCLSLDALKKRLSQDENAILVWDKDDEEALTFVTASANLRCAIFSIQLKSKFDVKSLAGNIIPAIATTNAIIAGLIVLQALKVIKDSIKDCKAVFLRDRPVEKKLIVSSALEKPNPKCYVCTSKPEIKLKLNTNTFTVKLLETKVLKQDLAIVAPDVEIDDGSGRIMISSEEGETEENNDKTLSFFGITDGSILKCDDFLQSYELRITIIHSEELENGKEYEIVAGDDMKQMIEQQMEKKEEVKASVQQSSKVEEKRKRSLSVDEDSSTHEKLPSKKRKTIDGGQIKINGDNGSDSDVIIDEDTNQTNDVIVQVSEDSCSVGVNSLKVAASGDGQNDGDDVDIIECTSENEEMVDEDDDDDDESVNSDDIEEILVEDEQENEYENGDSTKENIGHFGDKLAKIKSASNGNQHSIKNGSANGNGHTNSSEQDNSDSDVITL